MGWLNKFIGGMIGLMLGGPLGMIAGVAFASMIANAGRVHERTNPLDQQQQLFYVGAFSLLAYVASADGAVTATERQKVVEFIRRDLRLDYQTEELALRVFDAALKSNQSVEAVAAQFYQDIGTIRDPSADGGHLLSRRIRRRNDLSKEEALILKIARLFHFSDPSSKRFSVGMVLRHHRWSKPMRRSGFLQVRPMMRSNERTGDSPWNIIPTRSFQKGWVKSFSNPPRTSSERFRKHTIRSNGIGAFKRLRALEAIGKPSRGRHIPDHLRSASRWPGG